MAAAVAQTDSCGSLIVPLQLAQLLQQAPPGQPLGAPVLRWRWRKAAVQRVVAGKRHLCRQIQKYIIRFDVKVHLYESGGSPLCPRPAGKHWEQWNKALNRALTIDHAHIISQPMTFQRTFSACYPAW